MGAATAAVAGVSLLLRGSYRPAQTLSASAAPTPAPGSRDHLERRDLFDRIDHDECVVDRRPLGGG